jgi:hypothetical protein
MRTSYFQSPLLNLFQNVAILALFSIYLLLIYNKLSYCYSGLNVSANVIPDLRII